jgi:hypothetical protein
MLKAKDLSDTTHRHSLGWHQASPSVKRTAAYAATSGRARATPEVADFKSERVAGIDRNRWPDSNRNHRPTSFRNGWPTCAGISSQPRKLALTERWRAGNKVSAAVFRLPALNMARGGIVPGRMVERGQAA